MTSLPGSTNVATVGDFQIKIDTSGVRKVFAGMPIVAYFWMRDYLFRAFVTHRLRWFAAKGTKFGRAGGIQVWKINEGPEVPGPLDVVYSVHPKAQRIAYSAQAQAALDEVRAEAFTGNKVLPIHEFGKDLRTSRWMAVPVKTLPGSPKAWREKNPSKELVARPSKRDSKILLFEIQKKRNRGRTKKGAAPTIREHARLRFILTRNVQMRATLKMYSTWDVLEQDRSDLWQQTATKMLRDFERADPRDIG